MKQKILFVCQFGEVRSFLASKIASKNNSTHFAGVSDSSNNQITSTSIDWADRIYTMEKWHKVELIRMFPNAILKDIRILGVPKEYIEDEIELEKLIKIQLERENLI